MKEFMTHTFDLTLCQKELNEFKELLDNKMELSILLVFFFCLKPSNNSFNNGKIKFFI